MGEIIVFDAECGTKCNISGDEILVKFKSLDCHHHQSPECVIPLSAEARKGVSRIRHTVIKQKQATTCRPVDMSPVANMGIELTQAKAAEPRKQVVGRKHLRQGKQGGGVGVGQGNLEWLRNEGVTERLDRLRQDMVASLHPKAVKLLCKVLLL
jgi:hypothetical protein